MSPPLMYFAIMFAVLAGEIADDEWGIKLAVLGLSYACLMVASADTKSFIEDAIKKALEKNDGR